MAVLSRRVLGHTLSASERTISRWESGRDGPPSLPAQRVLAAVFEVPIDTLGFAQPDALTAAAGVDLSAVDAGPADALELVARITRSDVSAATLELLARRVDRLCRDYPVRPAPELLTEARSWLDRTLGLLERRTSLGAHRELLVSAGWLSALVACLHYDLGHRSGAQTWREATGSLGTESGHAEITGWSHEIAAWMAFTADRPTEALVHAQAGQRIDRTSCVAAQLAAQEARAAAKLGDRSAAEDAMARGRAVLDRLPDPADPDHHFVIDPAKADFYAMGVYRWLGVGDAAQEYAQLTRAYCERPDGTIRSPMRRSEALLTLGAVAARRGDLNAAVAYGLAGLGDPRKCMPSLLTSAADLDAALDGHRTEPVAAAWRDALAAVRVPLALKG
ncbi:MAG: XRE family transcriptional regulator [Actinomycetota bacterium]|nr:XRE family transcriptional regulator [Actinomycetota bacterium]